MASFFLLSGLPVFRVEEISDSFITLTIHVTQNIQFWAFWHLSYFSITCSRYSDSLRAGQSRDRIPVGARFSALVQTGPGAHRASYIMGTEFSGGGEDEAVRAWR